MKRSGVTTFSEIVDEWLKDRRTNVTEASADRYEYLMRKHILPEFGNKDINEVGPVQLSTYIASLGDKRKHGENAVAGSTLQAVKSLSDIIRQFAATRIL